MAQVIRQLCDEGMVRSKKADSPCAPNEATALLAGYEAWKERYPVEPADEQGVARGAR